MSHSDDQGLLTHIVSSGGDDVTDSVTETSGTEIRDSGSSHMHAKLYAFYPGKKRLCGSSVRIPKDLSSPLSHTTSRI